MNLGLSDGEIAPRSALMNLGLSDGEIAPRFVTNGLEGNDGEIAPRFVTNGLEGNDMAPELCRLQHAVGNGRPGARQKWL